SAQPLYNDTIDVTKNLGELCDRPCSNKYRICYFKFTLENYATMGPACGSCGSFTGNISDCFNDQCVTADGVERGVLTINRQIPGPSINVCYGDTLIVDVENMMMGYDTTIHWHGIEQRTIPWMDGVPMITQCPIGSGNTFRYEVSTDRLGTYMYYAYSAHQKANGIYGGLVVRPKSEKRKSLYDVDSRDYLIVLSDWMHELAEMYVPGLRTHQPGLQPTNLLINGKGTTRDLGTRKSTTRTPLAVFYVQRNSRYRFRLVNAMSFVCPVLLEIEGHKMTVITSDYGELQPITVTQLVSNAGERFEFVLNADQLGVDYWMRFRALGSCEANQIEQYAVLSYRDPNDPQRDLHAYPQRTFPLYDSSYGDGSMLNFPKTTCGDPSDNEYCISDLYAYDQGAYLWLTETPPTYKFILGIKNLAQSPSVVFKENTYGNMFTNLRDDVMTVGAINNISFTFQPFPILTQGEMIENENDVFCNENNIPERCESQEICDCTHRLKIRTHEYVEMIIVDETDNDLINHPFHIHGNPFAVVEMGQHPDNIPMTVELAKTMEFGDSMLPAPTPRSFPLRDTVSIPSKGFVRLRLRPSKLGFWMMRFVEEWYMARGMNLLIQVGETKDFYQKPEDFPRCQNYKPVPAILSVISAQSLYNDSIDITNNPGELCDRTCGSADYRRICYFKFTLENYATMGPACKTCGSVAGKLSDCFNDQCVTTDGVERAVLTINRQLPSPSIFVCERDLVVIDVVNMMMGYETTIHWHGFHQKDYPWMDGVPMITQCPINSGNTFRYKFWASESGTHWYHSHSGHQKSNGIFGGIVVRKHVERHASLYDDDSSSNLIVLSDWKHELAETHFPGLRTQSGGLQPANLLVNGKGTTRHLDARKSTTGTPLAVYYVQKNRRYRFRLVNAGGLTCPVLLEIEGHKMTVIASDSNDLQPTTVSQLVSNAGERFDFVVNANQSGVDYWMRFRALGSCEANQIEQYAVLTYRDPNDPQRDLRAYPQNNFPAYDSSYGDGSVRNYMLVY
ncbi:CLUMA_CG010348, isoform A, partial [Clunio marinus]